LINAQNDFKLIQLCTAGKRATNKDFRATVPLKKEINWGRGNNFNPGTTVATISVLTNMIFEGQMDEVEVSKLSMDMPLLISFGAINDKTFMPPYVLWHLKE
jgi:HlyD family secretion protein